MNVREAVRAIASGSVKVAGAKPGELPAVFYPDGWIERADALRTGKAKPRDWEREQETA